MRNLAQKFLLIFTIIPLFFTHEIIPQATVIGRLVDENVNGLADIDLELYINPDVYYATSQSDGSFIFTGITDVEDEQLPTGFYISNNFPNPFNPTTRIMITLPHGATVRVAVYNILGQIVMDEREKYFNAGVSNLDLELNNLPSGCYFARISIDEKYMVIKKMMLIYGSQHLSTNGSTFKSSINFTNNINKTSLVTNLDSLIATSSIIGQVRWNNLPPLIGNYLDLGDLTIWRYCPGIQTVTYEGKIYNTVIIGTQCWLKENLDVGVMIPGIQIATNNALIEKYCYDDNPANCDTFGGLYQWDEAMIYSTTAGVQGICPDGWHIPTLAEFQTLVDTVGEDGANTLKAIGQGTGIGAGTNVSGYSALLAGDRHNAGHFVNLGVNTYFWSSTEHNPTFANYLYLISDSYYIYLLNWYKAYGFSVRCIKDSTVNPNATVTGVGTLPPGEPGSVLNTRVALYTSIQNWNFDITYAFTACDGNGNYTMSGIEPGVYYMDAWKDNNNNLIWGDSGDYIWWYGSGIYPNITLAPIQLPGGQVTTVNFELFVVP